MSSDVGNHTAIVDINGKRMPLHCLHRRPATGDKKNLILEYIKQDLWIKWVNLKCSSSDWHYTLATLLRSQLTKNVRFTFRIVLLVLAYNTSIYCFLLRSPAMNLLLGNCLRWLNNGTFLNGKNKQTNTHTYKCVADAAKNKVWCESASEKPPTKIRLHTFNRIIATMPIQRENGDVIFACGKMYLFSLNYARIWRQTAKCKATHRRAVVFVRANSAKNQQSERKRSNLLFMLWIVKLGISE